MLPLHKGRYRARFAESAADIAAAQGLRSLAFLRAEGLDRDRFDTVCKHVVIEDLQTDLAVCCYRLLSVTGDEISNSYSAQFYDLSALSLFQGPMLELGRFCIRPDHLDPDILRLAWAALTRIIDGAGVRLLFGCTSFRGTDAGRYAQAFAMLSADHLAPKQWMPKVKAAEVVRFADAPRDRKIAPDQGLVTMPPLLRTYLAMGGWVSDHAVIDRDLDTLHVFTGLDISAIPAARARLLRAVAGS